MIRWIIKKRKSLVDINGKVWEGIKHPKSHSQIDKEIENRMDITRLRSISQKVAFDSFVDAVEFGELE